MLYQLSHEGSPEDIHKHFINKQRKSSKQREGTLMSLSLKNAEEIWSRESHHHHGHSFTSLPSSWFCLVPWEVHPQGAPKLGNKISSSHSIPHNFIWHYPEREKRSLQAALEEQRGSFPSQEHTLALCVGRNRSVIWRLNQIKLNKVSWSTGWD